MYSANLSMNTINEDNVTAVPISVTQRSGFIDYKDFKQTQPRSRLQTTMNRKKNILLKKASIKYIQIMENINPSFKSDLIFIPRRTLTNPREPSKNHGHDNINDDYILKVNGVLGDIVKYEILDLMGQGTFGQVAKCRTQRTGELVAVKVIKRQPSFLLQGDKEINILMMLRDRPEKDRFLQLRDCFTFRGHTCAVFELLSISLHRLFSQQSGRPNLAINDIQKISYNILETLALLKDMRIIHTDLKPDNILLKSLDDIHNVKLIDYGSALLETEKLNYCVQTAFYRSPEVILHVEFDCAIDMWSFGCFVAELFLGRPLFPSGNESTLINMMVSLLGCLPPDHMLKRGKNSNKFFHIQSNTQQTTTLRDTVHNAHDMPVSKSTLEEKIMGFVSDDDDDNSVIDNYQEMLDRKNLYDFLKKILVFDPFVRLTPRQALRHPFITSVMGNISRSSTSVKNNNMPNNNIPQNSNSIQQPPPQQPLPKLPQQQQQQQPIMNNVNNTQPLSPALIFASLVHATANNNSSFINTSRTTEDSQEIRTPLYLPLNRSKDNLLLPTPSKSPKVITLPPNKSATTASSPPTKVLRSILKKPNNDYQQFIPPQPPAQQENTLDSRVAFLYHQPRPESTTLSVTSNGNNNQTYNYTSINTYDTTNMMQKNNQILQQQQQYPLYTTATTSHQFANAVAAVSPSAIHSYQQQQTHIVNNNMNNYMNQAYITTTSPLLYHTQQYLQPQQQQQQQQQQVSIAVYPNRHLSPLQQLANK